MVSYVENEACLASRFMLLPFGKKISADLWPAVKMAMNIIRMIKMDYFYLAFHDSTPNPLDD